MTPKQFKPIILRTLKEGKKFSTVDSFADYLIDKMEQFEDMFVMALEVAGTNQAPQNKIVDSTGLVVSGLSEPSPPPPVRAYEPKDVSERFKPKAEQVGFQENFTKEELFEAYMKFLPPTLTLQPPGCKAPITLTRGMQRGPGDSFEDTRNGRISYSQPGVSDPNECVSVIVSTTDNEINPQRVIDEITKQANGRYSSERKVIPPHNPLPAIASLDDTIRDIERAPWNTTDDNASAADLAQWGPPSAGVAAAKYGK